MLSYQSYSWHHGLNKVLIDVCFVVRWQRPRGPPLVFSHIHSFTYLCSIHRIWRHVYWLAIAIALILNERLTCSPTYSIHVSPLFSSFACLFLFFIFSCCTHLFSDGAALCYTSLKDSKNLELLQRYIVHLAYRLPFSTPASIVERDAVFM